MPVTVVVGGQYGSEGKGKVAHFLAREMNASVAIRCGGTNSGHTVIDPDGNPIIFRQLPTASILPDIAIVLCAGTYIDIDILKKEIEISGLNADRELPYSKTIFQSAVRAAVAGRRPGPTTDLPEALETRR